MPIYTFLCSKCKHQFTDMFSMNQSQGKGVICPKCKNKRVKRVYKGSFFIGKSSSSSCPTGTCSLTKR